MMSAEILAEVKEQIEASEKLLIGIGAEWKAERRPDVVSVYNQLAEGIRKNDYFIITTNEDCEILNSQLDQSLIATPSSAAAKQQWDAYTDWLTHTLNKKLVILELGVGFGRPEVIRWPFEKTAFYNNKAHLYRINQKFPQISEELNGKATPVKENSVEFIQQLW